MVRPDARSITQALRRHEMTVAKRLLREWWIGLRREQLPGGDCWIVGGYYFLTFQTEVLEAVGEASASSAQPRIFIGRSAFWSVASAELLEAGQVDELRRRLPGVLQIYNPQAYATWARLMASAGRGLEAGKYFMFSGLYDDAESDFVARFKRTFARAHPNEIVGRMPRPCMAKSARHAFPPKVFEDLATVPCPDWLTRRP